MRIGIVGAGAIGGWIGILLAQQGHDVSVLARGATLAALKSGPWQLSSEGKQIEASVQASADATELGAQDVIVVAVKGPALATVAPAIKKMIGPDTVVIPAMNGVPWWFLLAGGGSLPPQHLKSVDPNGTIAEAIPFASVIGCVVHASATAPAPGSVIHKGGKKLILGEPAGGSSQRLEKISAVFEQAGFEIVRSDHIQQDIWYKLWGNMTMNPISALTGATCDRILDDDLVNAYVLRVMTEAAEVGKRIGCEIKERGEDRNAVTRQLGAFKTSMLQDAEAGRPIELDQLLAAPREIAHLVSVPTPNMDALLGLARLFGRVHGFYH
jgi:2-dehydropantoate 2-reductase